MTSQRATMLVLRMTILALRKRQIAVRMEKMRLLKRQTVVTEKLDLAIKQQLKKLMKILDSQDRACRLFRVAAKPVSDLSFYVYVAQANACEQSSEVSAALQLREK